jgi:hypothetical protein
VDLLNHDLAHKFSEHLEKTRSFKAIYTHFAKLFDAYGGNNLAIKNASWVAPLSVMTRWS